MLSEGAVAHTCAIIADTGTVKCWGDSYLGQIGDNSQDQKLIPTSIADSSPYSVIAAGEGPSCGILTDGGSVKCWGYNESGQLGCNSYDQWRLIPTATTDSSTSYSAISAGKWHTCGLIAGIGSVKCWGDNTYGQLGDGVTSSTNGNWSLIPISITDSSVTYSAITAGGNHTCAITANGLIKCWGLNGSGELGDNSYSDRFVPVFTADSTIAYSAVSAGYSHTCGITIDAGTVRCWGSNTYGQLGDGTTVNRSTPVDVKF